MGRSGKRAPPLLRLAGWDIDDASVSIGGQETCIILPSLRLAFDIGRCPQRAVYMETLCVSHCHMDHVGGAGFHAASRGMLSLPPPTFLLPPPALPALARLFEALRELDGGSDLAYLPVSLAPGGEHALAGGRHVLRPFPTVHPVPSQANNPSFLVVKPSSGVLKGWSSLGDTSFLSAV